MHRQQLLDEIRSRLSAAYGDRLCQVVMYGSEARGDAGPESDIDVLVLLQGPIHYLQDTRTSVHALVGLMVEVGRRISPKPVDEAQYRLAQYPLYCQAQREGVTA